MIEELQLWAFYTQNQLCYLLIKFVIILSFYFKDYEKPPMPNMKVETIFSIIGNRFNGMLL